MNKFIKKSLLLEALIGTFLLTSCDLSGFSENINDQIIDALIPNFWAFLTQLLALIIMIALIIVFAYKPLRKYIDDRSKKIQDEYLDASKNNKESEENLLKSKELISKSKKDSIEIIEQAKKEAIDEKKKILESADAEANKIKNKSLDDIKKMKDDAKEEIKKEIIDVALIASSKVLEREVSKEDNERLIDDFIENIKK